MAVYIRYRQRNENDFYSNPINLIFIRLGIVTVRATQNRDRTNFYGFNCKRSIFLSLQSVEIAKLIFLWIQRNNCNSLVPKLGDS